MFLAGRVALEADGTLIGEERFPGRQGRLLFAYLVAEQGRPVPHDELAALITRLAAHEPRLQLAAQPRAHLGPGAITKRRPPGARLREPVTRSESLQTSPSAALETACHHGAAQGGGLSSIRKTSGSTCGTTYVT